MIEIEFLLVAILIAVGVGVYRLGAVIAVERANCAWLARLDSHLLVIRRHYEPTTKTETEEPLPPPLKLNESDREEALK
jgi:hypothetical protein